MYNVKYSILIIICALLVVMATDLPAQSRFFAEKAKTTFYSDGVIEDISAENNKGTSIFDALSGDIAFLLNIKDFQFDKKLMQVHFNEKYMESDQYPKALFKGKVSGYSPKATGVQKVVATGVLTIHGVSHEVSVPGTMEMAGDYLNMHAKFVVKLEDYKIAVPQIVWQNIAQQVDVNLTFNYRPM